MCVLYFARQAVCMGLGCLCDMTVNIFIAEYESLLYVLSNYRCSHYMEMWHSKQKINPQDDNLKRDMLCQENDYVSSNVQCVLRSCRWWYRQPADRSPWGAVEDAGSASTAAVNTLPLLPASHHAATLPQWGPLALLRPHGWVAGRPSIPTTSGSKSFSTYFFSLLWCLKVGFATLVSTLRRQSS